MVVELIALIVSVVSVSIALHTKYRQRKKDELKGLANELQELEKIGQNMSEIILHPRSHEDNEYSLDDLAKEVLTGKYETGNDQMMVVVQIKESFTDEETIDDPNALLSKYKNGEMIVWDFKVGNLEELYTTDRTIHLHAPIGHSAYMYKRLNRIERDYNDVINEFDESLLADFKTTLDKIVKQTATHATKKCDTIDVHVEEFENTEEIGTYVFETSFLYDGIEDDIEDFNQKLNRIEEFRTTVLQASYS